ncbi:MAG: hypothetical protein EXR61_05725 [Chloroflexi bacterium]|nr:hypothetical protein [Chloroflexota bacterium]
MLRGRHPLLYAVSFLLTTALELYGTSLGVWAWAPVLPGLMLPAGNPPAGIDAGYCAMDGLTRRIVPRLTHADGPDHTVPAIGIERGGLVRSSEPGSEVLPGSRTASGAAMSLRRPGSADSA